MHSFQTWYNHRTYLGAYARHLIFVLRSKMAAWRPYLFSVLPLFFLSGAGSRKFTDGFISNLVQLQNLSWGLCTSFDFCAQFQDGRLAAIFVLGIAAIFPVQSRISEVYGWINFKPGTIIEPILGLMHVILLMTKNCMKMSFMSLCTTVQSSSSIKNISQPLVEGCAYGISLLCLICIAMVIARVCCCKATRIHTEQPDLNNDQLYINFLPGTSGNKMNARLLNK